MKTSLSGEKHVLIVDDEAAICEVLKEVMSGHGFSVEAAKNWPQVLKRLEERCPDLVVLDLMIPGAPAPLEMIAHFRQHAKGVPLVIISGRYGDPNFVQQVRSESNVKDFFKKPFGYVDLTLRIHQLLGTKAPEGGKP